MMNVESRIMLPMGIEATAMFEVLDRNADSWRRAVDMTDEMEHIISTEYRGPIIDVNPPKNSQVGGVVNLMA